MALSNSCSLVLRDLTDGCMPARGGSTIGRALRAESHCPRSCSARTADNQQTKGREAAESSERGWQRMNERFQVHYASNGKTNAAYYTLTSLQTPRLWFPMLERPRSSERGR